MQQNVKILSKLVNELLASRKLTLSTAESCTGGNIAAAITSISGSSLIFKGAVVAYSNDVKINVLKVDASVIDNFGAVSRQTVVQMADGVMRLTGSDVAVAISGIAGPGGATAEKPVGTVWVAIVTATEVKTHRLALLDRGREENILAATSESLSLLLKSMA